MKKFILGTKKEMRQIFTAEGKMIPVTVLSVGPMTVLGIKTEETDGYNALVVGYGQKKEKNVSKAQKGAFGNQGYFRHLKEFRYEGEVPALQGDVLGADTFETGDKVSVSSISKGKGFQGVVKRHGFKGGSRTHGQKHSEREPGSIGATGPQRVLKGTRMAGRMGGDKITVKNLEVMHIDAATGELYVKGAVPGRRGTLVEVRTIS